MQVVATTGQPQAAPLDAFELHEREMPTPGEWDLLVRVDAVSVNPVDTKIRQGAFLPSDQHNVLGWDAVGRVERVGANVEHFAPGDRVYYAGEVERPGCNAEYQLVDARLTAKAPSKLSAEEAAAMPLTALTAWEALFDKLKLAQGDDTHQDQTLLIINGAGGVGSIATQMARQLTGIKVIATASRDISIEWCRRMGAHEVVDHHDLVANMQKAGHEQVDYIFNCHDIGDHWENMTTLIRPLGHIVAIAETQKSVDLNALQGKAVTFSWEFMFARPLHGADIAHQGRILATLAEHFDSGHLRSTLSDIVGPLTPTNLGEAHRRLETGHTTGKLVLSAMPEA
ncbi:zinc-binding alcohol dehydrogenase family protein [Chromohalobacter nigrandesensis]|uniref:zinc-binding alcohol dehydrogenase family protein n=1 Tax=Chromohalobacter nigrandesensis TaxID=119863 RepID=UPI001FF1A9C9|nr:zinc-binding alcohol dehydrogenase family protein [Chromohalobacter nigrandesensis]MCK0743819.1 zinc-binding alcohol dehydrogenase family protein [Chromohalobacter nigrandesensis]